MVGSFFGPCPRDVIDFAVFPKRKSFSTIYEDIDGKKSKSWL